MMDFLLPHFVEEGKSALVIAVGCTGGRHRSVAVTHALCEYIQGLGCEHIQHLPPELAHRQGGGGDDVIRPGPQRLHGGPLPLHRLGQAACFRQQGGAAPGLLVPLQVSEKHAGFVINRGGATCGDIVKLMAQVRERVLQETGVTLPLLVDAVAVGKQGIDVFPEEVLVGQGGGHHAGHYLP